ncbi:MAG: helix-turn-helix domain-containing protein [Acidimicrobiia bacterium]
MGTPRSFDDYPPVLDSHDVAELLGFPIATIQQMVRERHIPARPLPGGRRYRFIRDEIIELLLMSTSCSLSPTPR